MTTFLSKLHLKTSKSTNHFKESLEDSDDEGGGGGSTMEIHNNDDNPPINNLELKYEENPRMSTQKIVLIPTAIILIETASGVFIGARAVLDIGSNANVISKEFADKLGFIFSRSNKQISMIGGGVQRDVEEFQTTVKSRHPMHENFSKVITCLMMPRIQSPLPFRNIEWKNFSDLPECFLADPRFFQAGQVDMILSSDVTLRSFLSESFELSNGAFIKETKFGYIVTGGFVDKYLPNVS